MKAPLYFETSLRTKGSNETSQKTWLFTYVMWCSQEHGYLPTYCMVQSPSWEASWFAASQEIPRILRNPKVHYRTHKRPPPVPILGQPNTVHRPISHLLETHPNIIHPSTPRSPQWSLPLRFPHQGHGYGLNLIPHPTLTKFGTAACTKEIWYNTRGIATRYWLDSPGI